METGAAEATGQGRVDAGAKRSRSDGDATAKARVVAGGVALSKLPKEAWELVLQGAKQVPPKFEIVRKVENVVSHVYEDLDPYDRRENEEVFVDYEREAVTERVMCGTSEKSAWMIAVQLNAGVIEMIAGECPDINFEDSLAKEGFVDVLKEEWDSGECSFKREKLAQFSLDELKRIVKLERAWIHSTEQKIQDKEEYSYGYKWKWFSVRAFQPLPSFDVLDPLDERHDNISPSELTFSGPFAG